MKGDDMFLSEVVIYCCYDSHVMSSPCSANIKSFIFGSDVASFSEEKWNQILIGVFYLSLNASHIWFHLVWSYYCCELSFVVTIVYIYLYDVVSLLLLLQQLSSPSLPSSLSPSLPSFLPLFPSLSRSSLFPSSFSYHHLTLILSILHLSIFLVSMWAQMELTTFEASLSLLKFHLLIVQKRSWPNALISIY